MKKLITFFALLLILLVGCVAYHLFVDASFYFLTVSFSVVSILFLAAWKITRQLEKIFI